jgi:hypothetical protein
MRAWTLAKELNRIGADPWLRCPGEVRAAVPPKRLVSGGKFSHFIRSQVPETCGYGMMSAAAEGLTAEDGARI